ncbi:hypothetical protein, partial [Salmonella sp. gx-f7]|uniref:hypothetical protein n=1 Tax=Salmonella sp. gx-f7 TaxID=2582606 RepID=UPI001F35E1A5
FIIAQLRRAVLPKFCGTVWAIRQALGRTAHFLSVFAAAALAFFVHILYYRVYACFTAMRWPLWGESSAMRIALIAHDSRKE